VWIEIGDVPNEMGLPDDREMLDQMLQVFGLRPDHDLGIMRAGQGLAEVTAACLTGLGRLLRHERPDLVLVPGKRPV